LRNEKPGPGRFREFLQFDADFVGTKSLQADVELCVMISDILEKCGLSKSEYVIKISSRKITEELFKKININKNQQKLTALRALDKIDRLGWQGVKELLGEGRKDKSGDFTKGANLSSQNINIIEKELKKKIPETEDLKEVLKIFKDYNFDNFEFDPSIIRGLEYYTGTIFEVNLRFDVTNNKGQVIQFGSIGGGGRYDNLVSNFGNYDAPATGISIGLDRLVYALMQKKEFKIKQSKPVVICVFDKNSMKDYVGLQTTLRKSGISTEIYPGENKLKKQMEYANKIKSPAVILYGEDEIKSGKPTLRDLSSGKEKSIEMRQLVNEIKKII
jgi:histidyl-tRNA synthetase